MLFNIHGGAFQTGDHSLNSDPAGTTAMDCVLVTASYRLGVLFAGPSLQNLGPVFDGINFDGKDALEIIRSGKANYVTILGGHGAGHTLCSGIATGCTAVMDPSVMTYENYDVVSHVDEIEHTDPNIGTQTLRL